MEEAMNGLPATLTSEISTPAISVPVVPAGEVGVGTEEYPIIEIPGAGCVHRHARPRGMDGAVRAGGARGGEL